MTEWLDVSIRLHPPRTSPRADLIRSKRHRNTPAEPRSFCKHQVPCLTLSLSKHSNLPLQPRSKYAGKDATEEFEPIHPPGVIGDNLPEEKYIGPLDPNSVKEVVHITAEKEQAGGEAEGKQKPDLDASSKDDQNKDKGSNTASQEKQIVKTEPTITQPADPSLLPHISSILSLHDFEHLANRTMSRKAWAYYSSGADDEITMRENTLAFQRIWFRPRVLRNVKTVDYSTTVLGAKTSMPVYIVSRVWGGRWSLRRRC